MEAVGRIPEYYSEKQEKLTKTYLRERSTQALANSIRTIPKTCYLAVSLWLASI
jgi:hypothetical protein